MGLFDKKYCDICGNKIGLLGNKKLLDGNMCKDCAEQMSPWLTGRKEFSVAEMQQHIAYRQANYDYVRNFQVTDIVGANHYKLYINRNDGTWFISYLRNYVDGNPDVLYFSQVTGCFVEVKESSRQLYAHTPDHRTVPLNPPEYDYDYNFYVTVYLADFVTNTMTFRVNSTSIDDIASPEYKENEAAMYAMKDVFDQMVSNGQPAAGQVSAIVVPEPYVIDAFTREQMHREAMMRKDMQRRRIQQFEAALATGGPGPHGPAGPAARPSAGPAPAPRPASPSPAPAPARPTPAAPAGPAARPGGPAASRPGTPAGPASFNNRPTNGPTSGPGANNRPGGGPGPRH